MTKPLYLLVAKSASGKTTVAEILESQYGLKSIQSYTTRPKRYEDETGHTFISEDEFDKLENIMGYNKYNGYRYCCTKEQLDAADIYVVDVPGVETLLDRYQSERPIIILYFDTSVCTRIDRMIDRHDSDMQIVSRIYNDEKSDWLVDLKVLKWHYAYDLHRDVTLHIIDANQDIESVMEQVIHHIKELEND